MAAEHPDADAGIVAFQRRSTPRGDSPRGDSPRGGADVLEFAFRTRPGTTGTAGPPRRSALQRALPGRLDGGGHGHLGRGRPRLP